MADFRKVRVMISSRCSSRVRDGDVRVPMTAVRQRLQRELAAESLCGEPLFEVWISDNAPDQSQGDLETAWEKSLEEVRKADLVLVLYTGEAGWAPAQGLGVCHAEFEQAWNEGPARVKVVRILDAQFAPKDAAESARDATFQACFSALNPTSSAASSADEIVDRSREALREAVAGLVKLGGREARKGRFAYGASLDWSRMDFAHRKAAMEDALGRGLAEFAAVESAGGWLWTVGGSPVLTLCHGLPGGSVLRLPARWWASPSCAITSISARAACGAASPQGHCIWSPASRPSPRPRRCASWASRTRPSSPHRSASMCPIPCRRCR